MLLLLFDKIYHGLCLLFTVLLKIFVYEESAETLCLLGRRKLIDDMDNTTIFHIFECIGIGRSKNIRATYRWVLVLYSFGRDHTLYTESPLISIGESLTTSFVESFLSSFGDDHFST